MTPKFLFYLYLGAMGLGPSNGGKARSLQRLPTTSSSLVLSNQEYYVEMQSCSGSLLFPLAVAGFLRLRLSQLSFTLA